MYINLVINCMYRALYFRVFLFSAVRCYKKWVVPTYRSLYKRRLEQGPEHERHRSEWLNWYKLCTFLKLTQLPPLQLKYILSYRLKHKKIKLYLIKKKYST